MTQHPRFQPQRFWTALKSTAMPKRATAFVGVSLLLSLAIVPAALARNYKPSKSSRPSGKSIVLSTRGPCREAAKGDKTEGALTALAPVGHTGQTTATHPTFAWYVPENRSYPIEFTLYRYAINRKPVLLYKSQLESQKGIMQHSLPQAEAGLNVGETYLWQVALLCNLSSPDKDRVLRTEVEVVAAPTPLQASLAKTADHSRRANLYAEAGFWYDALAEARATDQTKPFVITLLEDLVNLEGAETSEKAKRQHDQLQQVLNAERQ